MADNVELNSGSGGATVAADEIGGVHYQRTKVVWGADGSANDTAAATPLPVQLQASNDQVDSNNTTTTPLAGGATYTGTGTDVLGYQAITITLAASHDSAASGMKFQFSTDNSNWDDVYSFTMDVSSSAVRRFQFPVTAQYFRVVYTNGGTLQTHFRVQTILHSGNQLTSIHRLDDNMSLDRSAQVMKVATFAKDSTNSLYKPVAITANSQLAVANQAATTGGMDIFRSIDLDESEEQVKATAGNLYVIQGYNAGATTRYIKVYNATAAAVTVGVTTPVLTFPVAKTAAFNIVTTQGFYLDTAITVAATTGLADNDTGAPSANDVIVNIGYK